MNETNHTAVSTGGWQAPFRLILWGLAAGTILPAFQGLRLDILLPLLGMLLLLLGFRALRRQNRFFQAGWLLSLFCAAQMLFQLAVGASPSRSTQAQSPRPLALALTLLINGARLLCLWGGLRQTRRQAGLPPKAAAAGGLAGWYLSMCLLALTHYQGLLVWVMLAAFVALLIQLNRSVKELDQLGFPFVPAPAKLPDWLLSALLTGGLAICVALLALFAYQYPMDWQPLPPNGGEDQVQQIKEELLSLGFPAQALDDLEDQQILDCRGALRVITQEQECALNPGSQDLLFAHTAVQVPGQTEHWKIFHHFLWRTNPGFWGTESIRLWPASHLDGWQDQGNFQGRLLYETLEGQTMTAPFYSQGLQSVQPLFGNETSQDWFAAFSLPKEGQNRRGYLCYDILARQEGWLIDSWVNYTHQKHWQYPAETAQQHQLKAEWLREGAFITVQSALQLQTADMDGDYRYQTYSDSSKQA